MLRIKTTGVEDFIDGSANIKALVIGGPGAGKTRMSSYWPKPIYLDCENGRGSLADRNMPYAEIKHSKDMLDALEYLKGLEKTPKANRQFQTVVLDTADSYQRLVKDEWVSKMQAPSFSGFDAWGYLDTRMQQLFTRLLNLDYNVVVLVHYTSKEHKDGDNTVRELTLQLQGNIKDTIFNDFGLVGWLGTYWASGEQGKVQKRGLTFQPTTDKSFLKDRFNVTPKWMPIEFTDNDYQQLFEAFFNRPEIDAMTESQTVGEIPDSDGRKPAPAASAGLEGGPLPERAPAEVPLEKKLKGELESIAKGLGVQTRGNMLKDELITLIKTAQDKASQPTHNPTEKPSTPEPEAIEKGTQVDEPPLAPLAEVKPDPTSPQSSPNSQTAADAPAASPEDSTDTGEMSIAQVGAALGGTVLRTEQADTPTTQPSTPPSTPPGKPTAPKGPSACADCGNDISAEWADPSKRDYLRLSYVKKRRYLCESCRAK